MSERAPLPHVDRDDVVALRDVVDVAVNPDTAFSLDREQVKRARRVIRALDTYANQRHPEHS